MFFVSRSHVVCVPFPFLYLLMIDPLYLLILLFPHHSYSLSSLSLIHLLYSSPLPSLLSPLSSPLSPPLISPLTLTPLSHLSFTLTSPLSLSSLPLPSPLSLFPLPSPSPSHWFRYVPSEEKKTSGVKREVEMIIHRKKPHPTQPGQSLSIPYRVLDNPLRLTPQEW